MGFQVIVPDQQGLANLKTVNKHLAILAYQRFGPPTLASFCPALHDIILTLRRLVLRILNHRLNLIVSLK